MKGGKQIGPFGHISHTKPQVAHGTPDPRTLEGLPFRRENTAAGGEVFLPGQTCPMSLSGRLALWFGSGLKSPPNPQVPSKCLRVA